MMFFAIMEMLIGMVADIGAFRLVAVYLAVAHASHKDYSYHLDKFTDVRTDSAPKLITVA